MKHLIIAFISVLLASNYSSGWEAVFVGALQGGFIFLCLLVYRYFKNKRNAKKEHEEAEKDKVSAFIETTSTEHDNNSASVNGSVSNSDSYLKSVFKEMAEKCNPQNYMNPYDHEKVRIANEIYSSLMSPETLNEEGLMSLRHRAIVELGVVFDTKAICDYLSSACNPANFMNPYDAEKVRQANDIYAKIQQNKHNIEQLEALFAEAKTLGVVSGGSLSATQAEKKVMVLGNWKSSEDDSFIHLILIKNGQNNEFHYYLEKQVGSNWERDIELLAENNQTRGVLLSFIESGCPDVKYQIKSISGDLVKYENYAVVETFKKR